MISDDADPTRVSQSKIWTNIAYSVGTVVFIMQAWNKTLLPDVWLIYLGIIGAHTVASKMIGSKYGAGDKAE